MQPDLSKLAKQMSILIILIERHQIKQASIERWSIDQRSSIFSCVQKGKKVKRKYKTGDQGKALVVTF